MEKKVLLFLADGFEEIEALAPVDLLRRAGINVTTVSISDTKEVRGGHDITVLSDKLFDEIDDKMDYDMIILPGGGVGTENLKKHDRLNALLLKYNENEKLLGAICAAPSVLGKLNILNGKKAICYPGFEAELLGAVITNEDVVKDKNIITSKAAGTSIKFALEIIQTLLNTEASDEIKSSIMYL